MVAAYPASGWEDVVGEWTWDSDGVVSHDFSGDTLSDGDTYFVTAVSEDAAGNQSQPDSSDGIQVDLTGPSLAPVVYDDGDYTREHDRLNAHWSDAADPGSGIAYYMYAIGALAGSTDVWD